MSSSQTHSSLEEEAERLKKKAEKSSRAQNVEQRVSLAKKDIRRISSALTQLHQSVRDLQFHAGVLTEVFDQPQPKQVDDAVSRARNAADITDRKLLEEADEGRLMSLKDDIDRAESAVNEAKVAVLEKIDRHVRRWEDDISSARELDRIISSGNSNFSQVIYNMSNFLASDIENQTNTPSGLASRWERLKSSWDEESDKQGWEAFKTEYGLSDPTVRKLKKFTEQKSVNLSEFTAENLNEIKQVDELESAIKLQIDSS